MIVRIIVTKGGNGMSVGVGRLLSSVLAALQVAAQMSDSLPAKYKQWSMILHILVEVLMKEQAARFNPDGTPASVAYVKEGVGIVGVKVVGEGEEKG